MEWNFLTGFHYPELEERTNMKKYLPIGSVVLLKNSSKRVMIAGFMQKQKESGRIWDYSACLYPEGIIHPDQLYLFDADQIDQIYFIGFQDKEGLDYLDRLSHYREGKNDEGSVSGKVTGPDPE